MKLWKIRHISVGKETNVSHVEINNSHANINSLHGNINKLYQHASELFISFIANLTSICLFGHRNPPFSATHVFCFFNFAI